MLPLPEIENRLCAYLGTRVVRLSVLASGWETTVFEFTIASRSPAFAEIPVAAPVVLRFYGGSVAVEKGVREHITIDRLSSAGFSVPRPYAFERDVSVLGAPFMIMERLAGGPLLTVRSFPEAFKTFSLGFFSFVRAQARLHRYDPSTSRLGEIPQAFEVEGINRDSSLLSRVIAVIGSRVEKGPLPGLRDALGGVAAGAASLEPVPASVVHMDYHPLNVMVRGTRVTGVIDWANADMGDRHLDAAVTSMILSSWALEKPRWMRDNLVGNALRASFASLYVPLYHAMAPMNLARFRYCQTVAALFRLSTYGMMRARGPEALGYRAEALDQITDPAVRALTRYASRKSGTVVRLEPAPVPI
jgi:aminoglycoside phosphotransferase (APT) family kinase protein